MALFFAIADSGTMDRAVTEQPTRILADFLHRTFLKLGALSAGDWS